jgi:hypothetical protein
MKGHDKNHRDQINLRGSHVGDKTMQADLGRVVVEEPPTTNHSIVAYGMNFLTVYPGIASFWHSYP